jgi:hypothetical protein
MVTGPLVRAAELGFEDEKVTVVPGAVVLRRHSQAGWSCDLKTTPPPRRRAVLIAPVWNSLRAPNTVRLGKTAYKSRRLLSVLQ